MRIRIRIKGLSGSGSGLRFLVGSGFDEYGSETLENTLHPSCNNSHISTSRSSVSDPDSWVFWMIRILNLDQHSHLKFCVFQLTSFDDLAYLKQEQFCLNSRQC